MGEAAPVLVVSGPAGAGKSTTTRLLVETFEPSALVEQDAFLPFIRRGWVDPAGPDATAQHRVLGGAIAGTAIEFAAGGYTVVLDAQFALDAAREVAGWAATRGVALHYALLWADLESCVERVMARDGDRATDRATLEVMHRRFASDAGETHYVVDTRRDPAEVAAEVRARFLAGDLLVP